MSGLVRTFRYRLYPTRAQDERLRWTLERLRELYNAALEERREAYRRQRVKLSGYAQMSELKLVRQARPEYATIHSHALADAIVRLDGAFSSFFRRLKAGQRAGYPRFRGPGRYNSITFKGSISPRHGRVIWLVAGGRRLDVPKIGKVKIKLHRPLRGRVKRVTVSLDSDGHWYASFCCDEVPYEPLLATGEDVGLDVGINTFATLSTGEQIENPRHRERSAAALSRAHRRVGRRRNGGRRRRKAAALLARAHARVRRSRLDFHHKVARDLVCRFDRLAVEALNIKGLARMSLSRQVLDAAWAQFVSILASKAECAGRELIQVNPRDTSRICSECGTVVPKLLRERVHRCPHCGYTTDRDHNAARVVEQRAGLALRGGADGCADDPRSAGALTRVDAGHGATSAD